jgi:hypothetical protein
MLFMRSKHLWHASLGARDPNLSGRFGIPPARGINAGEKSHKALSEALTSEEASQWRLI